MKLRTVFIILISVLMIGSIFASAVNVNKIMIKTNRKASSNVTTCSNMDSAEVPIWHVGDSWIYDVHVVGGDSADAMDFDISMPNLEFEVVEVQDDMYRLDVTADLEGSVSGSIEDLEIEGTFQNAEITQGVICVNKSDLAIVEITGLKIEGDVKGSVFTYAFTIDIEYDPSEPVSSLSFPLYVGKNWNVSLTYLSLELDVLVKNKLTGIKLLDEVLSMYLTLPEHNFTCARQVTKNGYDDAFEITGDLGSNNDFWYAADAGNIVKVDYEDIRLYWGEEYYFEMDTLEMTLTDTTYEPPNTPPDAPTKPSGPTSGRVGPEYSYCTSGTDPDSHQVQYGFDWNEDDVVDDWTDPVDSGETACVEHSFNSEGTYYIKAKTQDEKGAESEGWSPELEVYIAPNDSPSIPTTPDGDETMGTVGFPYGFSTSSSDPESDQIKYGWDLYGDGVVDEWTNLYDSAELCTSSLIWEQDGTFSLKVKAKDQYGATSEWSDIITVTMENNPPEKPNTPSGPTNGKKGNMYTYTTSTIDPDGHRVKYWFDWDDGTNSGWIGPFDSETNGEASHTWDEKGDYNIRVKAKDEYNSKESNWSDPLPVTMPINKNTIKLEKILDLLQKLFPSLKLNKLELFY
jgi:hypothetical protein